MRTQNRGITLIELVVVVAIVALLATIAIPSYRQFVLRSHRAEATVALLALAAAQEKHYLQNNTYTDELTDAPPDGLGLQATTENGYYDIEITEADADGFSATATATGGQADDGDCPSFSIDQAGTRGGNDGCWAH